MNTTPDSMSVWPVVLYGALVLFLLAGMVILSYLLGERHHSRARNEPYESGITPTESARIRYGFRYYLVAVFFLLFDIEAAMLFAWAVAFREADWFGYVEAVFFYSYASSRACIRLEARGTGLLSQIRTQK